MLKKRYKLFVAVFVLLLALGAFWSTIFPYSYVTPPVDSYQFVIDQSDEPIMENIPLMFSFDNGTSILHCAPSVCDHLKQIRFRYPYDEADSMPVSEFAYQDFMNGTILAQSQNSDGSVQVSAKSSTLITQGFDSFAWDSHTFGDSTIPVEIGYYGSSAKSTEATVLVYGEPYTGRLRLCTNAGKDKTVEITDGTLTGLSIYDLRKGLAVTIVDESSDTTLIGTYVAEDYPIFSSNYLSAMSNLFLLILLIAAGCTLICIIRKMMRSVAVR